MAANYFESDVLTVDRPLPASTAGQSFWRMEDPVLVDGKVVKGGMWEPQRKWWDLKSFVRAFVAGYGSGKTVTACKRAISLALQNPGCPVAVISPTFPMARQTTIVTLQSLLAGKQTIFGRQLWWRYNKQTHEFRIRFRGRTGIIIIYSGDNPLSLKGPNLAAALIDEPFIQHEDVFHQMIARVRHPDAEVKEIGLFGCVTRDTLVLPRYGMLPIGQLDPCNTRTKKYSELSVDLYGSFREFHRASHFYNNGVAETRRIVATHGFSIEATLEHPLLVMGEEGSPGWRRTDRLKIGDWVAIGRGMEVWGTKDPLEGFKDCPGIPYFGGGKRKKLNERLSMTEDLAYFLGLWLAEGSSHPCGRITISCGDDVITSLETKGVCGLKFRRASDIQCVLQSAAFLQLMDHVGMPLVRAPHKRMPAWVFQGRREWALAFLAGMYDGDGHVALDRSGIGYTTASERLAKDLQLLLLNLNVVSHINCTQRVQGEDDFVPGTHTSYQVTANGSQAANLCSCLPLRIDRKRRALRLYRFKSDNHDYVPSQASLVVKAWESRSKERWRKGQSREASLDAWVIASSAKKGRGRVSRWNLSEFVRKWELNEPAVTEPIRVIQQNLKDGYFWAQVRSLEEGQAETVDFVVPDTHSFWSNGFISHNTPEKLGWGFDLCVGEMRERHDVGFIQASTRSNLALGTDYVKRLEGSLTGKAAQAYIEGAFVNLSTGLVYYAFNGSKDPETGNILDLVTPQGAELGCGMDFNVNPMSACVFWRAGSHMHVFDEIELPNSDTQYMCSILRERYVDLGPKREVGTGFVLRNVYPDPAGAGRRTAAPGGRTDFHYIKEAGFNVLSHTSHPEVRDRENSVNGKFAPAYGRPSLTVSPKCKRLIKYLLSYSHELKNKQKHMSHILDGLGYAVQYLFPVTKQDFGMYKLTGL